MHVFIKHYLKHSFHARFHQTLPETFISCTFLEETHHSGFYSLNLAGAALFATSRKSPGLLKNRI